MTIEAPKGPAIATLEDGEKPVTWAGLSHLLVVYFVWGSTYLAIRVAVREGSGFPPFVMGGSRLLVAGLLLLVVAALRGRRLKVPREDLAVLLGSGVLLWGVGHGLVAWAEQRADSGYAALLIGTVPIWAAVLGSLLNRRAPTRRLVFALLVGFMGIGVLTLPVLRNAARADVLGVVALLLAPIAWSFGSLWQQRRPGKSAPIVSSAFQQLVGGLVMLTASVVAREPTPDPLPEAWVGWGYLVVFGALAFTSYVQALRLLPNSVVMTYAYVNPVVAVVLGWLLLREPITVWTVAGTGLVLAGVAGVFRERSRRPRGAGASRRAASDGASP